MILLSYATLVPDPQGVSAIRFSSGVRVLSLRVFPTGSCPFAQTESIAQTEPDTFYFDLYLNAQPNANVAKDKQKTSNALARTRIAYAGGQRQFSVDMGKDYTTRLLLVRGAFEKMTITVYGVIAAEVPPPPATYTPIILPIIDPTPFHRVFDVANTEDPTGLARTLLQLMSPSLSLGQAVAETLCQLEIYQNGTHHDDNVDGETLHLHELFDRTRHSWISHSQPFAELFGEALRYQDTDSVALALISGILRNASRWQPQMIPSLLGLLDTHGLEFSRFSISYDTLARLNEAAANRQIASFLNSASFHRSLDSSLGSPSLDPDYNALASSLKLRLQGWEVLSDALHNTKGTFDIALAFVDNLLEEQSSLGVWAQYLVEDSDFLLRLSENPSMSGSPPLSVEEACTSHEAFVAYVRGFIGITFTVCVFLYADINRHDQISERILDIIRLWRACPGYREIVGRLVMLPSVQSGLKAMMSTSTPNKLSVGAEELLSDLSTDAQGYLHDDFVDNIQAAPSLANLPHDKEVSVRRHADICNQPADVAIEHLHADASTSEDPIQLRLIVAMVASELKHGSDINHEVAAGSLLKMLYAVVDAARIAGDRISQSFHTDVPSADIDALVTTFLAAHEALRLLLLLPLHSMSGRLIASLTSSIATIFVGTWYADMLFSSETVRRATVQSTRHTCVDVLRALLAQNSNGTTATHVFKTLLIHALCPTGDPTVHLAQVFYLVNQMVPNVSSTTDAIRQTWTTGVIPNVLQELSSFMKVLDPENSVHLANLLSEIDQGEVGFAQWFLQEHLQRLRLAADAVVALGRDDQRQSIRECELSDVLRVLKELLSYRTPWVLALLDNSVLLDLLTHSLGLLTSERFVSLDLFEVAHIVVRESAHCAHAGLVLTMVRCAQAHDIQLPDLKRMLGYISVAIKTGDTTELNAHLQQDLRRLVLNYVEAFATSNSLASDAAGSHLIIIQGMGRLNLDLAKSNTKFMDFSQQLIRVLPPSSAHELQSLLASRHVSMQEDEEVDLTVLRHLQSRVSLSLDDIQRLVSSPPHVPRTPTMSGMELAPDLLAIVMVSPSALLRSPATSVAGLTKTYTHNAFREQTQRTPFNTSRMPSMHVDDYEVDESPIILAANSFTPSSL